jgi:hypothetical protein
MLVAALLLALSIQPPQQTAGWGDYEWRNGIGRLSEHYFRNGTGFPSGYELEHGTRPGSFYHLIFGTRLGSAYFWDNGVEPGSAYFWRNGVEPGSQYYWRNGQHCLSEYGWREGAICDGKQILTFQSLCVAQAIDLPPCREINARLEAWLERSSSLSTGDPALAITRMREAID